ncbi:ABC transporter permease, partial [Staphylococcus gallinarum]
MKYKKHGVTQLGTHQHDIKVKLNKEINQVYFMSDVDLGGPTLVLNDKDYQYLRNHTKAKNIVSQYG